MPMVRFPDRPGGFPILAGNEIGRSSRDRHGPTRIAGAQKRKQKRTSREEAQDRQTTGLPPPAIQPLEPATRITVPKRTMSAGRPSGSAHTKCRIEGHDGPWTHRSETTAYPTSSGWRRLPKQIPEARQFVGIPESLRGSVQGGSLVAELRKFLLEDAADMGQQFLTHLPLAE